MTSVTAAHQQPPAARRLLVPKAPVLVMDGHRLFCLTEDGEWQEMTRDGAEMLVRGRMPIVCNGPALARHLKTDRFHAYDVLELFAFIHPGRFAVPTPRGIARALHLLEPQTAEDQCLSLRDAIRHLLADLSAQGRPERSDPAALAAMMGLLGGEAAAAKSKVETGWPWTPVVLAALGRDQNPPTRSEMRVAMRIWDKLPEWAVHAPEPAPGHYGVDAAEAAERLHKMLSRQKKEERPQQRDYAAAISHAFMPRHDADDAKIVLAEAGTGTGKTLGYLAPATVWAEKNGGPVWISTFTRNLQKQVESELAKLYDDPITHARKVVTRKGRENYLCLLNLEDAAQAPSIMTNDLNATALGLMLRWAAVTDDGDLMGKDFPGWLVGLVGWNRVHGFADRRGECIYSACPHFNKCFIEKSLRKARRADIVIANHALVMHQTAAADADDALPTRYIFDEGHHIFDAADSAFCAHLSGSEAADLRRWLLGSETQGRSRARGIKKRLEDIAVDDEEMKRETEYLIDAAKSLPGPGWRQRVIEEAPKGSLESFLILCRQQVHARNKDSGSYSLETPLQPAVPGLFEAACALSLSLQDIKRPMTALVSLLKKKLEDEAETLETSMRERITYMINSLTRRAQNDIGSWISMLDAVRDTSTPGAVDWLEVTRMEGHDIDVGFYRYAVDPVQHFAHHLKPHAQGAAITSATLRDASEEDPAGWASPLARTGALHLSQHPEHTGVPSPFDYAAQTRIIVIGDVNKENPGEVAAAYRALFAAAGGGALGIFTSIRQLKNVHEKLVGPLENAGLHLYAQHVDPLDTGTLIDIFREEENACLLGTDATRDGIDVPGRSLRLVVYDRVPWPRPTILHKARRAHFGKGYDDMLTRFKLKQAYGRLIRTGSDKGVFVMLDARLPSRLAAAFPAEVAVERVGLAEAVRIVAEFTAPPFEA